MKRRIWMICRSFLTTFRHTTSKLVIETYKLAVAAPCKESGESLESHYMHPSSCKPGSNSFTRSGSPIYSTQSSISRSIMDWEGIAVVRMRWQHSNHSYAPRYIQKHTKIQHLTRKFQFNQEFRLLFRYLSFTPILNYTPKVYIRCKSPIIVMRSKLCYTMSWLAQAKVLDKRICGISIMKLYHDLFSCHLPPLVSPFL